MTHINPKYRDRAAIAPYNFVPLAQTPAIAHKPLLLHDRYFAKADDGVTVYSGSFTCELTTETPIYIRGMLSDEDFAAGKESKNKPDFFSVDAGKTPCIPGSSLRGLFRHMVEMVANARLHPPVERRVVYSACTND